MSCCDQGMTFMEPQQLLFNEALITLSKYSGTAGDTIFVSLAGYSAGETLRYRWYRADGSIVFTQNIPYVNFSFRVDSSTAIGTYRIEIRGNTSGQIASVNFTVVGSGTVGDFVTRGEFDAFLTGQFYPEVALVTDIQDQVFGDISRIDADVTGLSHDFATLQTQLTGFGHTVKNVDIFTLNQLIQLGRWTDEHVITPKTIAALDEITTTNNLSDATVSAALTAPLLQAAPYTSGTGGGTSFWDQIKNFFAGFGLGSTATLVVVGILVYFFLIKGKM